MASVAAYAFMGGAAAVAVITVSLAARTHQVADSRATPLLARPLPNDCVVHDSTFLATRDLGAFSVIAAEDYRFPPYRGSVPRSRPPVFAATFRGGQLTGLIANVAVTGPDRPAEDAWARSLHYTVGRWPLVPLQGPVVRHNHGLLEAYETALAFTSDEGAKSWIGHLRASWALEPQAQKLRLPDGRADGVAYWRILGPDDGAYERMISYTMRFGTRILALDLRGGSALQPATVDRYWRLAVGRFVQACG